MVGSADIRLIDAPLLGAAGCGVAVFRLSQARRGMRHALPDAIGGDGVSKPGSYITMGGDSTLLVIPDSKLVVFSYMD